MKVVVPMAGSGEAFSRHGFVFAKPLIEIAGRPLIEHALDCLRDLKDADFVFVVRKEDDQRFHLRDVLQLLAPGCSVIQSDGETAGAACTVLLAVEHIDNEEELVIANADQILKFSISDAVNRFRGAGLDGGTVTFESVHPRWSFVKTNDEGMIVEAAEKRPISRQATAGVYYFRRGADFVEAAKALIRKGASVNGGYYVCPAFNEMILGQKRLGTYAVDREAYVSLATPQAIEEYEQRLLTRKWEASS